MKVTTYPAEIYVFRPKQTPAGGVSKPEPADIEAGYPVAVAATATSENGLADIKKTLMVVGEWLKGMNKNEMDDCTKAMRENRVYISFGESKTITVPLLPTV